MNKTKSTASKPGRPQKYTRPQTTVSLEAREREILEDASEILSLSSTDFVRLALRDAVRKLYISAYAVAAMHAHRHLIEKAEKRCGRSFQEIDFMDPKVQAWLRTVPEPKPPRENQRPKKNQVLLDPSLQFESAFDNLPTDENSKIHAERRQRNRRAFTNPPEIAPWKFGALVWLVIRRDQSTPEERRVAKAGVKSEMDQRVRIEFMNLKQKLMAIPALVAKSRQLGADPNFLELYQNDPEALLRFIKKRELDERRQRDPSRYRSNAASGAIIRGLVQKATLLKADGALIKSIGTDERALREFVYSRVCSPQEAAFFRFGQTSDIREFRRYLPPKVAAT